MTRSGAGKAEKFVALDGSNPLPCPPPRETTGFYSGRKSVSHRFFHNAPCLSAPTKTPTLLLHLLKMAPPHPPIAGLGKVAYSSLRRPKPLLDIDWSKAPEEKEGEEAEGGTLSLEKEPRFAVRVRGPCGVSADPSFSRFHIGLVFHLIGIYLLSRPGINPHQIPLSVLIIQFPPGRP